MNKGITLLILLAVLGAMGIIFFSHTSRTGSDLTVSDSGATAGQRDDSQARSISDRASPLQERQDGSAGLAQIAPPLSTSDNQGFGASRTGADGAPPTVVIRKGSEDGSTQTSAQTAAQNNVSATPGQNRPESSIPGVTSPVPGTAPGTTLQPITAGTATPSTGTAGTSTSTSSSGRSTSGSPALTAWDNSNTKTTTAGTTESRVSEDGKGIGSIKSSGKQASLSDKGNHSLKDIGIHFAGQKMIVRIEADSAFPCKIFTLSGPERLVIDLPGTWKGMKTPQLPDNRIIKNVRMGTQPAGPRLVLDLNEASKNHKLERDGNIIEISIQ